MQLSPAKESRLKGGKVVLACQASIVCEVMAESIKIDRYTGDHREGRIIDWLLYCSARLVREAAKKLFF